MPKQERPDTYAFRYTYDDGKGKTYDLRVVVKPHELARLSALRAVESKGKKRVLLSGAVVVYAEARE